MNRAKFPVFGGSTGKGSMAFFSTVITHKNLEFILLSFYPHGRSADNVDWFQKSRFHKFVTVQLGGRPLSS